MTPFERALRERIASDGPISVEAYMEVCNSHYYATRDPLGARGDFTTAPEISQMFGELTGAALADVWMRAGSPATAIYAELGPGRGTLAADALRVLRSAAFSGDAHLVETSPLLREQQALAAPGAHWHERVEDLPQRPLLLVANEFFDALPVRQLIGGHERHVIAAPGGLAFDCDGTIQETSPAREAAMKALAARIVAQGGIAIVIDYGHERSGAGDTLQAVRSHEYTAVLECPGEQDLTAHVDFEALANVSRWAGATVTPLVTQGEWLNRMGIGARAAALASTNPERAKDLAGAVHRLTARAEMGQLFKVLAIHAPDWPQPPGFA